MKTEKRKAKVGERILITGGEHSGVICVVENAFDKFRIINAVGVSLPDGGKPLLVNGEEYEVIIEEVTAEGAK